jgi:hypothetical protein
LTRGEFECSPVYPNDRSTSSTTGLSELLTRCDNWGVGIRNDPMIVAPHEDAAADCTTIRPSPTPSLPGRNPRLVRIVFAVERGKDVGRIGPRQEIAGNVGPDPAGRIRPHEALRIRSHPAVALMREPRCRLVDHGDDPACSNDNIDS